MFYDTRKNDHGLPHNPFKAIVAPRPIGWITTMSAKGETNLAPYSFFNGITDKPPIVMFSSEGAKDSVAFAEETKEFVCSLATFDLRDKMKDRKSTRLNSSHLVISYAVFCLKKKNKTVSSHSSCTSRTISPYLTHRS